jgi:micrococcal nuclease
VLLKIGLSIFFLTLFGFFITPSESTPEIQEKPSQVAGNNTFIESEVDTETSESKIVFYQVTDVIDGDTIKVSLDDKQETVRLVNMNTPETVDPRKTVECLGEEASKKMEKLVLGKNVSLEIDETQNERDQYGRLLRFVYLEDETDVGLEMIKLGYAESTPYGSSPHQYIGLYDKAQEKAKEQELGLWNPEACIEPMATPPPKPTLKPSTLPTSIPHREPTLVPTKQLTLPPMDNVQNDASTETQETSKPLINDSYTCNCSKTCGEMSSCEEAYYQLEVCGCTRRDGDNDGVPCENICPGG